MRILFVIETLGGGGRERRLVELIKGICRWCQDIELHLSILGDEMAYVELYNLQVNIHKYKFENNTKLLHNYFQLLKSVKPSVVQTWTIKTSTYFSFLKVFFSYKLLASFVADSFGYRTRPLMIQGVFINFIADKVIGNSNAGLESYHIPMKKRVVIYNGYDNERLKKNPSTDKIKKKLNVKTPYIVLMVANISKHKDYNTFVKVARIILKNRNDLTFISIGGGEYLQKYRSMLDEYENAFIKFLGFKDDVDSIIEACDIGLLCTFSEGVSNAILEYMMHNKPVIATGTGGTKEIVLNGETGFVLPASSPEIVANKIIKLIEDPILRKEMGSKGYKFASNKFSLSKNTMKYYQLYRDLNKK